MGPCDSPFHTGRGISPETHPFQTRRITEPSRLDQSASRVPARWLRRY
jgi:hypothetical protein